MATHQDLLDAIERIRAATGDPDGWMAGLSADDMAMVANPACPPATLSAVVAKVIAGHPDAFIPEPVPLAPRYADGAAAEAIRDAELSLAHQMSVAAQVDLQVVTAVLNAHATHADGVTALDRLQREIEAAVASRTDLDTPAGARAFQRYLIDKLRDIRAVVETAGLDATSKAALAAALASLYASSAPEALGPVESPVSEGPPRRPTEPEPADGHDRNPALVAAPAGVGSTPRPLDRGLGALPPWGGDFGALPPLGGDLGALPPLGGDFGALPPYGDFGAPPSPSTAVAPAPVGAPPAPVAPAMAPPAAAPPTAAWGGGLPPGVPFGGLPSLPAPAPPELRPPASDPPVDVRPIDSERDSGSAADEPAPEESGESAEEWAPGDATTVELPDGDIVTAPSPELAGVLTAAVEGVPIPDAFRQHGITIPVPGSVVTAPVEPARLLPGDIGVLTDRHALALGNGKALLDQQIQPVADVSGPGFIGWQQPPEPIPEREPPTAVPESPALQRPVETAPS